MSRRPAVITQADIARTLRAMHQVQYPGTLEIAPDGTMRIVPCGPAPTAQPEGRSGYAAPHHAPIDDDELLDL